MLKKFKNLLKKIFPIPTYSFYKIMGEVSARLARKSDHIISTVRYQHKESQNKMVSEFERIAKNSDLQQKDRFLDLTMIQQKTDDHILQLAMQQQALDAKIKEMNDNMIKLAAQQQELVKAFGELTKASK